MLTRVVMAATVALSVTTSTVVVADDNAKQALQERLQQLRNLQASFQQTVTAPNGEQLQQIDGELTIQRPNQLRWKSKPPDDTLMVASGESVWYYNSFVEQVTIYQQSAVTGNNPMLLLLDANQAQWQQYQVTSDESGEYLLESASEGNKLALEFDDDVLQRITLQQSQGDTIDIHLSQVQMNQSLPEELFSFDVPAGVDVDDQR